MPKIVNENFPRKRKRTSINNQVINVQTQQEKLNIMRATETLMTNGSCPFVAGNPTDLQQSMNMLEAIGCCVVNKSKDFSLMLDDLRGFGGGAEGLWASPDATGTRSQTQNPNVIDVDKISKIKNKQIKADDKFGLNDPFYELDDKVPRNIELQNKSVKSTKGEKQIVKIGSDLAKLNLGNTQTTLKYFISSTTATPWDPGIGPFATPNDPGIGPFYGSDTARTMSYFVPANTSLEIRGGTITAIIAGEFGSSDDSPLPMWVDSLRGDGGGAEGLWVDSLRGGDGGSFEVAIVNEGGATD